MKNLTRNDIVLLLQTEVPQLDGKTLYIYGGGKLLSLHKKGCKEKTFSDR